MKALKSMYILGLWRPVQSGNDSVSHQGVKVAYFGLQWADRDTVGANVYYIKGGI